MKTKTKTIRISDDLLSKIKEVSESEGINDTKLIEKALKAYFNGNEIKVREFFKSLNNAD